MPTTDIPSGNRLLALLPDAMDTVEPVELEHGDVLGVAGQPLDHVYFPTGCVIALFSAINGRAGLGVGLVGREGMVGIGIALGARATAASLVVQHPGTAMRMRAARLQRYLSEDPLQQLCFFRFVYQSMVHARQVAVCSNFHETVPRLARWLLLTRDRTGSGDIRLTQGYLARMLGVRRASVTEAASELQRRNLISCGRGRIRILDARRLEVACCHCYQAIKQLERTGITWPDAAASSMGRPDFQGLRVN